MHINQIRREFSWAWLFFFFFLSIGKVGRLIIITEPTQQQDSNLGFGGS